LKYEIVKGALVEWSVESPSGPHPPTAVLVHGILGSRRNLLSFAKRLAAAFPSWQFLLVDLRCHGQTAGTRDSEGPPRGDATNDVTSAAKDVLGVLNHLKMYPHALIGHSFGGKVAMSMVHQFGKQLPRPVQVWVLDTVPGDVWCEAGDHPRDTIAHARTIPMPIASRKARSYSHWSPYGPVGAVNAVSSGLSPIFSLRPPLGFNPLLRRLSTPLLTPFNSTLTFARTERP
jgi:pimeloyl-ACP methyl ester carboxylesterase